MTMYHLVLFNYLSNEMLFAKSRLANTPLHVSVYEVKWIQSHYALIIKFKNMSLFANRKKLPTSTLSIFIFQSTTGVVIAVDSMNCKITIIKSFEWESVFTYHELMLLMLQPHFVWNLFLLKCFAQENTISVSVLPGTIGLVLVSIVKQ